MNSVLVVWTLSSCVSWGTSPHFVPYGVLPHTTPRPGPSRPSRGDTSSVVSSPPRHPLTEGPLPTRSSSLVVPVSGAPSSLGPTTSSSRLRAGGGLLGTVNRASLCTQFRPPSQFSMSVSRNAAQTNQKKGHRRPLGNIQKLVSSNRCDEHRSSHVLIYPPSPVSRPRSSKPLPTQSRRFRVRRSSRHGPKLGGGTTPSTYPTNARGRDHTKGYFTLIIIADREPQRHP